MALFEQRYLLVAAGLLLSSVANAFDPWAGDLSKENPSYVRVLSYNVLNQFPAGTAEQTAAHARILLAVQPDVISYQEMDPGIAATLKTTLESILGGTWYTHEGQSDGSNVNVVASRWPQTLKRTDTVPASSFRGTTITLIDLPNGSYTTDLYFMGVHFACCSGADRDAERQKHADAIAAWMGDARSPGGSINLAPNTPMMVVGDQNFNNGADAGARTTLLTGAISDTATYGPAIKGDWDDTDIGEALPLNPYTITQFTFSSANASPTSQLDRFFYTDSVATMAQGFILNTLTIPSEQLAQLGLQANDTLNGSDHLPVVVDFALGGVAIAEPMYGDLFVTEVQPDPSFVPDTSGEWMEIFNRTMTPLDITGWVLKDAGSNMHVLRTTAPVVIGAGEHMVMAVNGNPATNGNVPADYEMTTGFRLANAADTVEIYRGSVKIDGIFYNGGAAGLAPPNRNGGTVGVAIAGAMQGDYSAGATDVWGPATEFYNPQDKGTPGRNNQGTSARTVEAWQLF